MNIQQVTERDIKGEMYIYIHLASVALAVELLLYSSTFHHVISLNDSLGIYFHLQQLFAQAAKQKWHLLSYETRTC